MNPNIFREYDIRGIAGKDMDDSDVLLIGRGIGSYLKKQGRTRLSIGRDCRITSDRYRDGIVEGLISTGCNVIDIGVCPTPLFYFSIHHLPSQGGVMVTASHNPPEYNGFKICMDLDSVHGRELMVIRDMIRSGRFETGSGILSCVNVIDAYHAYLESTIRIRKHLRVGVDAGNGTGGVVALPILKRLGCEVFDLYCDMDGTFPNHEADPTVTTNMQDLIRLVKENNLDVGIGFDGDTDRIGVVDERGRIVHGDQLMILFSREILARKPGATIISEVKSSQTLYNDIRARGGRPVMWKTGHSLMKKKMKEEKAELAGEMSGHMFFSDRFFGYDDAIYAACRLLEILSDTGKSVSELLADVPKTYNTPEIRVECPDERKFDIVARVIERSRETHEVIDIDGARILFNDGWGLVRASNTQPALVLRFEAASEKRLREIREQVEAVVQGAQKEVN